MHLLAPIREASISTKWWVTQRHTTSRRAIAISFKVAGSTSFSPLLTHFSLLYLPPPWPFFSGKETLLLVSSLMNQSWLQVWFRNLPSPAGVLGKVARLSGVPSTLLFVQSCFPRFHAHSCSFSRGPDKWSVPSSLCCLCPTLSDAHSYNVAISCSLGISLEHISEGYILGEGVSDSP